MSFLVGQGGETLPSSNLMPHMLPPVNGGIIFVPQIALCHHLSDPYPSAALWTPLGEVISESQVEHQSRCGDGKRTGHGALLAFGTIVDIDVYKFVCQLRSASVPFPTRVSCKWQKRPTLPCRKFLTRPSKISGAVCSSNRPTSLTLSFGRTRGVAGLANGVTATGCHFE